MPNVTFQQPFHGNYIPRMALPPKRTSFGRAYPGYELKSHKFVGWGDKGTPTAFRIRGDSAWVCCMARFVVGVRRLTPTYSPDKAADTALSQNESLPPA